MALHLRAQDQFGLQFGNARFDFQIVVADQRFDAVKFGSFTHFTRKLTAVGTYANDGKAHFLGGHLGGGNSMGRVTKHKNTLARQVSGVDRACVPCGTGVSFGQSCVGVESGQLGYFPNEGTRGTATNWNNFGERLTKIAL